MFTNELQILLKSNETNVKFYFLVSKLLLIILLDFKTILYILTKIEKNGDENHFHEHFGNDFLL